MITFLNDEAEGMGYIKPHPQPGKEYRHIEYAYAMTFEYPTGKIEMIIPDSVKSPGDGSWGARIFEDTQEKSN